MESKNELKGLVAQIPTKIKSQELIDDRRKQIIKGALSVFKRKGYHKTTVRDIAKAANISMGSLYDYINSKGDILYLFYKEFIFTYHQQVVSMTRNITNPKEKLVVAYRTLLEVGFSLEDEILFGWTEAKNMKKDHLVEVLKMESDLIGYFKAILDEIGSTGHFAVEDTNMTANFLVYSAMFGILRRWVLKPLYSNEQIIDYLLQTQLKEKLPQIGLEAFVPFS